MSNIDEDGIDDVVPSEGSTKQPSGSRTMVHTHEKGARPTHELKLTARGTELSVAGWRACAVETVVTGLVLCGILFIVSKSSDWKSSVRGWFSE
jgi:hypothetical protein